MTKNTVRTLLKILLLFQKFYKNQKFFTILLEILLSYPEILFWRPETIWSLRNRIGRDPIFIFIQFGVLTDIIAILSQRYKTSYKILVKSPGSKSRLAKNSIFPFFRPVWHFLRFLALRSGIKAKVGQLWGGLEMSQGDKYVHQA